MDSSGEQHLEIDHNIYKRRLDLNGKPIDEPKKEDITVPNKKDLVVNLYYCLYHPSVGTL